MDFCIAVAFGLILYYLLYQLYSYSRPGLYYFKDLGVPHIAPTLILGNLADALFRRKHIGKVIKEIYSINPDAKYVGVYAFMDPVFVIRDIELIKSILIKNFDHFADHKPFISPKDDPIFGNNLYNVTQEDQWKYHRNIAVSALTISKLKLMYEPTSLRARTLVKYLYKQLANSNDVFDMKDLFSRFSNDAITACTLGIDVDSINNPKNEFYVKLRESSKTEGIPLATKILLSKSFPRIMKLLNIKFVNNSMSEYFQNVVKTTVKMRKEKNIVRQDLLQLLMDEQDKSSSNTRIDLEHMAAHIYSFCFSTLDSQSNNMCLLAYELIMFPEIQKKVQNEIDNIIKKTNGKPTYDDINEMSYFEAVFTESLRYHSEICSLERICTKTFVLPPALQGSKPITIKPGTSVWIPLVGIHHDEKYFENPDDFDPDRYYLKKVPNDFPNMTFGAGPRICFGKLIAMLNIKILFFNLLANFNLKRSPSNCTLDDLDLNTFIIRPKVGFSMTVEPRRDKVKIQEN